MKRKRILSVLFAIFMSSVMTLSASARADADDNILIVEDNETTVNGRVSMAVGESRDLSGFIEYGTRDEDAYDPWYFVGAISWKSSNPDIASVNGNGTAAAHKAGIAKITATGWDNLSRKHVQKIIVSVSTTKKTTTQTSFKIAEGVRLNLRQLAEIHTGSANLVWSSSSADIAPVDSDGLVFAKSIGHSTVTAAYKDESGVARSVKYSIRVTAVILLDAVQESTLVLKQGDSLDVGMLFYPNYQDLTGALSKLSCLVSDTGIASCSSLVLKANKTGTTIATIRTKDGTDETTLHRIKIVVQDKIQHLALWKCSAWHPKIQRLTSKGAALSAHKQNISNQSVLMQVLHFLGAKRCTF